jgi:hypothetical protein
MNIDNARMKIHRQEARSRSKATLDGLSADRDKDVLIFEAIGNLMDVVVSLNKRMKEVEDLLRR